MPKAPSKYNPFKNKKLAKYRRNLVLKNLLDNSYIEKNDYEKFLSEDIILKKRKRIYLEDSRYYVEEVRKNVVDKYSFDEVYKKGFNIKTPLNLDLQTIATQSLRIGLENYDKRKGWRGALKNKKNKEKWQSGLKNFKLEKSIGWDLAIVRKIDKFEIIIETYDKKKGVINYEDIDWTRKEFNEILKVGDVIYVEKKNEGIYSLKQLPKANGGIVVMDPFSGRVLALSGGFIFKKSEFNRATQALRQPGSAFKTFIYALALENGFSPTTLVLDAPIVIEQGSDLKMW